MKFWRKWSQKTWKLCYKHKNHYKNKSYLPRSRTLEIVHKLVWDLRSLICQIKL